MLTYEAQCLRGINILLSRINKAMQLHHLCLIKIDIFLKFRATDKMRIITYSPRLFTYGIHCSLILILNAVYAKELMGYYRLICFNTMLLNSELKNDVDYAKSFTALLQIDWSLKRFVKSWHCLASRSLSGKNFELLLSLIFSYE